jgi:hypothetical protein
MGFEDHDNQEEIFSNRLKAGRRTYFFDVKETRGGEYYLTISELSKKTGRDGQPVVLRHKIFLYKEDFDGFTKGLQDTVAFVREKKGADYGTEGRVYEDDWNDQGNTARHGTTPKPPIAENGESDSNSSYSSDIRFEDL